MDDHTLPSRSVRGRPDMPKGYGIASDTGGLLDWAFVDERMARSRNYWIATSRPDGRPHVAPVWGVWIDGTFYFSTDPHSQKGRNLERRRDLVLHLESGDEVVIIEGTAQDETDAKTLSKYADAYAPKYDFRPDVDAPNPGVYRLAPRVVLAWREQDFPSSATRWLFESGPQA